MVAVEIRGPVYDEESGQVEWRVYSVIKADGDGVEVLFGRDMLLDDHDLKVVDCHSGKQLDKDDDPEGWARNLPYAFRAGDLVAVVSFDSEPQPEQNSPEPPQELPTIPSGYPHQAHRDSATAKTC